MNSVSLQRAGLSAGLYVLTLGGITMLFGGSVDLMSAAVDGAIVAGSGIGAEYVHTAIGMQPTRYSSALVTGAIFAGIQKVRGEDNLVINFLSGAGNDYLIDILAAQ